jgi:hypothetical protein
LEQQLLMNMLVVNVAVQIVVVLVRIANIVSIALKMVALAVFVNNHLKPFNRAVFKI